MTLYTIENQLLLNSIPFIHKHKVSDLGNAQQGLRDIVQTPHMINYLKNCFDFSTRLSASFNCVQPVIDRHTQ